MNVIVRAVFHRFDGCFHILKRGNHNHFDRGVRALHLREHLQPIAIRQPNIENHDRRLVLLEQPQPFIAGQRGINRMPFLAEKHIQRFQNRRLIINEEYFSHSFSRAISTGGVPTQEFWHTVHESGRWIVV